MTFFMINLVVMATIRIVHFDQLGIVENDYLQEY